MPMTEWPHVVIKPFHHTMIIFGQTFMIGTVNQLRSHQSSSQTRRLCFSELILEDFNIFSVLVPYKFYGFIIIVLGVMSERIGTLFS